ncbi:MULTISPECIES: LysR family transcriptional regulator [Ferrimonas]|uniref:LysR family transcriptional regulator n=1 Tax=Ferrimonas TaxID=44011 RepID=UPI0004160C42|nr:MULTISPECIES: LysR family transcriptional regulator [Ferrimonas]USD38855.1 LysR family transcriptional regulator [Ferrimonas sp. SCSIO 43195]
MNSKLNKLDYFTLSVFVELYEQRSGIAVARQLNSTQPKVSRALTCLREVFEDELFVRQQYGMIPNQRAEFFYPMAKELARQYQQLSQALAHDYTQRWEVNIAAQEHLFRLMVDCLNQTRAELGNGFGYNLHPWTPDSHKQINLGQLDYCISINPKHSDSVDLHHIGTVKNYFLVARKGHPVFEQTVSLPNLLQHPMVLFNYALSSLKHHRIEVAAQELGCAIEVAMKTSSMSLLLEQLARTDHISILASVFALEAVKERSELAYVNITDYWSKQVLSPHSTNEFQFYLESKGSADSRLTEIFARNLRDKIFTLQSKQDSEQTY